MMEVSDREAVMIAYRTDVATRRTNRPLVAGILSIIGGTGFTVAGLLILEANWGEIPPLGLATALMFLLIAGIMPIVGGVFALLRRQWKLALAGCIGGMTGPIFLAVPALVLLLRSRDEFD